MVFPCRIISRKKIWILIIFPVEKGNRLSVGVDNFVSDDKILDGLIHICDGAKNFSPPFESVIQADVYFRGQIKIERMKFIVFTAKKFNKRIGFVVTAVILHVKNFLPSFVSENPSAMANRTKDFFPRQKFFHRTASTFQRRDKFLKISYVAKQFSIARFLFGGSSFKYSHKFFSP